MGKAAIRIRSQGNINIQHHVIQDFMKISEFITLGVVTFNFTLNA